ncbi:LuxR family two component transcriptional regulator [Mangrovibacterium marinum]|uniref:LuxR family two component transcriptional regulator n=1 Tax=Mangrovibacterium marinum TaxID=1639118 RepID=A0A2T5BZV8_9BACT|nr:LuxR family two component transcriptional regulator [Mangrovibacterium marinum]
MIVGDYHILRTGLKLLLESKEEFDVVGEAADLKGLIACMENSLPDVIMLDLVLPEGVVVDMLKYLQRAYSRIPVVVIAVNASQGAVLDCVMWGVKGVVWKESSEEDLYQALDIVMAGENYFQMPPNGIDTQLINQFERVQTLQSELAMLSQRELQVLKLIAEGFSYKEIGERLSISPRTVETHKSNLLSKLNMNTPIDLVKYAVRSKLVD